MNLRLKLTLWLVLSALFGLVGCSSSNAANQPFAHAAIFDPPRTLTDFSAVSSGNQTFTLSEHEGQLILLYFGYRTCPDFCPTTTFELRNVYEALNEPADKLKVVFVTVDPERDDIEALTRYVGAFHRDFIALRTEGESLQTLMGEFGVTATKRQMGELPSSYLVDHTASIFIIGADGKLLGQYLYGTPFEDIQSDLQKFLKSV